MNKESISEIYVDGVLQEDARKKVWEVEINILKEIDRICCRHNLQYFLVGGTLIGAIRHNGFIPWDDDIDICMLRKDFDIFLEIAKDELPKDIFLQDGINEKGYFDTIVRVRDSRTTGIVAKDLNVRCNNGIFVEIYPLDFVCSDEKKYKYQLKRVHFCQALLHLNAYGLEKNASFKDRLIHIAGKVIFAFTSPEQVFRKMQEYCRECDGRDSEFVDELMTKYTARYRYDDVKETEYHVFEDTQFRIPRGYDNCLKTTFGDYMQLPPENKRYQHHNRAVYYDPYHPYNEEHVLQAASDYFQEK